MIAIHDPNTGFASFTLPDGSVRKLGNIVLDPSAPDKLKGTYKVFGSTAETPSLIARSEWPGIIKDLAAKRGGNIFDDPSVGPEHDQDGVGQCNAEATTGAIEDLGVLAGGNRIILSAADLYDQINGGSDNGSTLEDGIRAASTTGIATADDAGGVKIWHRGYRAAPASSRQKNVVLEWYLCPTFDHCFTAVCEEFRLVSGIAWYDNDTPDSEGWLPLHPRGNSGGHAIMGYSPIWSDRLKSFGIIHRQSWGRLQQYVMGTRFVIGESRYNQSIGGWWAGRVVKTAGDVTPPAATS